MAADGLDALNQIRKNKFDLVLLDVNLPKVDGFAILEKIRASAPTQPIIMISARTEKVKEDMAKEKEEMKKTVKKVEDELKAAVEKIQEFEAFQKQEEAVARFNSRMEVIDQGYELDDEDRQVLASDLKELAPTEEAFAAYQEKLAVMWKHKNKEAKAAFEKQIQARIDEEVAKKLSVSNASETKTAEELAQEALDNAKASEVTLPNNNEAQSQQPVSFKEKFANAFSRENIVIS